MIGGSRQTVNRLLADFVERGPAPVRAATTWSSPTRAARARPPRGDRRRGGRGADDPAGDRGPRPLADARRGRAPPRGRGRRLAAAPAGAALLRSIADGGPVFDAEAASIALYDPATDRLVFRSRPASRARASSGLAIAPDAGHRRLRLLDRPAARPRRRRPGPALRAGRGRARPGYVPRSLAGRPARRRRRRPRRPRGARPARRRRRSTCATSSSPRSSPAQATVAIRAGRPRARRGAPSSRSGLRGRRATCAPASATSTRSSAPRPHVLARDGTIRLWAPRRRDRPAAGRRPGPARPRDRAARRRSIRPCRTGGGRARAERR